MNILQACEHEDLFASWFRDPESHAAWFAFFAALFGLPMTDEQLAIYQRHTGRENAPTEPADEAWMVIGRRGGKSAHMGLVAAYLATFRDYRPFLAPGERATVMVIAADRRQARVIMRYIKALLHGVPSLAELIEGETTETIDLAGFVTIEVGTASFRSTRGYSYAAVLCDEIAFWRTDDAAEPDYAILDAVRPGMATIPGSLLLCASSPYAPRGALWDAHRRWYGKEGEPLVWQASTRDMNPTVPESIINRALERDAASASAEYLAQFRRDIEQYVSREVVESCVNTDVRERRPVRDISYLAFVDPSGGSADSMTMAIGHRVGSKVVIDATRERKPPFSPDAVVSEFAALLKAYGLSEVTGDRYAGEWPRERFRAHGIVYRIADQSRSMLYQNLLPLLNSGTIDLLDDERAVTQICGLERRTGRGGRESIDHGPGGHDDLANAIAGVASLGAASISETRTAHIRGLV